MKTPHFSTRAFRLLCSTLAVTAALTGSTQAAPITWDGNGDANASGLWEVGTNWTGTPDNTVPGTADNAQLLNVTTGTRTVTISSGSPQTINKLTVTQTTVGAFNVLQLDDNLTISLSGGGQSPFAMSATAGQGSIVTNIATGKTLLATNSNAGMTGSLFDGTLNLAAGSTFKIEALGAASDLISATFGGPINATGAGAAIVLEAGRFVQNPVFNGAITISNPGSAFTLSVFKSGTPDTIAGVGGSLTFNGNDGSGNAVNIAAGTELIFNVDASTYNFTNRVNLAAAATPDAGGKITFGLLNLGSGTNTANFNGGLVLGAGATASFFGPTVVTNLAGTSSMAAGASLLMKSDNAQGAWNLTNNGTFTMDGATVTFDWAAAGNNNPSNTTIGRRFVNTGTWTLENASSIEFISSTGRSISGGFGFGTNNENSGTFNVKSGSDVGFYTFFNTGTMNLGSSTSNVSNATVYLGSPNDTFGGPTLTNGLTAPLPAVSTADAGTINIRGNTHLGRIVGTGTTTLNNGAAASTGSLVDVGDGTTPTTFTVADNNVEIANFASNTMTLNPNSTLVLKYVSNSGTARLTNAGTLTMDNADLFFDYAAAGSNNPGNLNTGRRFVNSGTMTLENGSNLAFTTSTGRPTSGFGVGTLNENTGTLNVKSGSTLGFGSLYNTGTMNLGSSTAGVSDALVTLGSPSNTFSGVDLFNGLTAPTPTSANGAGTINILGNTWLGRTTNASSPTTTLQNGTATSTGSTVNVGDGTVQLTLTMANRNAALTNFAGNAVNLAANATLLLKSLDTANNSGSGTTIITNNGTFTQAGKLQLQSNFNAARTFSNGAGSTYRISGTSAAIEAMPGNFSTTNVADIGFTSAGVISGSSSADKLTYTNSTGAGGTKNTLAMTSSGQITPGNGSNGSGTSSIGSLEFANTSLTLQAGSLFTFDIGGTQASGLFDQFSLTGTGALMALGAGVATLDIQLVNSFVGSTGQTYQIITGASRTGTFSSLLFNGTALSGTPEYSVNYLANGVEITLAIPEPGSLALILGGFAMLIGLQRRRRQV